MSKSCLCRRIGVCSSIAKLNKDGCLDVIRLLQNAMALHDFNQFTTKVFMDCTRNWTCDQIMQLENEVTQTLSNNNYCTPQSQKKKNNCNPIANIIKNIDIEFPLLRLPIDLITKTTLYLNENDIFQFERCCRLFYQMINNASYLNLSHNFKTFTIDDKRLDQISQMEYSFFKYSKAECANLHCDSDFYKAGEEITMYFTQLRNTWENAQQVCINHGWFNNMFKSIKTLDIFADCMVLLDKLPLELLFDPVESHLNEIDFDHYWGRFDERFLTQYINKFETKYFEIQHKLEQQGKQMRQLKVVRHASFGTGYEGPSYILAKHLHMTSSARIDLDKNWLSRRYQPLLRKLTCDKNVQFDNVIIQEKHKNNLEKKKHENINIDTLRLREFTKDSACDICNDKIVIEWLNLQNSLKNLMLDICICNTDDDDDDDDDQRLNQWQNVFESIVKKEYFYKLENVIILFEVSKDNIEWIFNILKENIQLLKYQFNKFIVGLSMDEYVFYHVLEWNKEIDNNYLDKLKANALCSPIGKVTQIQDEMKEKYFLLANEWST